MVKLTIFLSAFLLFLIQLITAKWVLPWFGGSPSVWTTCMLFYQAGLFAGYLYAHLLSVKATSRMQSVIHVGLLLFSITGMLALALLWNNPILPDNDWKPDGYEQPVTKILQLLLVSIGFPFFLLSSTSPLMQKWVSEKPGASPYRLYAVSNAGSLLALLSYPLIIEPYLTVRSQSIAWTAMYLIFVVSSAFFAKRRNRAERAVNPEPATKITSPRFALWIGLAACGTLMLLAATNQICREVAVVPFLWIVPLAIYLLTFIVCFEKPRLYSRTVFHLILIPCIVLSLIVISSGVDVPILFQILTFTIVLFVSCMICHGELYRSKPEAGTLTHFYVAIAGGGALGGVLSAIVAPLVLKGYWEFHFGLFLTMFLAVMALRLDPSSWIHRYGSPRTRPVRIALPLIALGFVLIHHVIRETEESLHATRNFYGVLTVLKEDEGTGSECITLQHGRIRHGYQFTDPRRKMIPTSYYGIRSGIGKTLKEVGSENNRLKIGVIGLGVGTIAAYGRSGDTYRFYEIDRDVAVLAKDPTYFQYLMMSPARTEIVLGDGRISLEREAPRGSQNFDVLAIDAFSSDSIPAHLLTQEAMETYLFHLKKPSGILAFHISNRYLELEPVVLGNAKRFGLRVRKVETTAEGDVELASTWMMLSFDGGKAPEELLENGFLYWTDDYHSILPILEWSID